MVDNNDPNAREGNAGNPYLLSRPFTYASTYSPPHFRDAHSTPTYTFGSYDHSRTEMHVPSLHLPSLHRPTLSHPPATSYPYGIERRQAYSPNRTPATFSTGLQSDPRDIREPLAIRNPPGDTLSRDRANTYAPPNAGDDGANPPTVERLQSRLDTSLKELESTKKECADLRAENSRLDGLLKTACEDNTRILREKTDMDRQYQAQLYQLNMELAHSRGKVEVLESVMAVMPHPTPGSSLAGESPRPCTPTSPVHDTPLEPVEQPNPTDFGSIPLSRGVKLPVLKAWDPATDKNLDSMPIFVERLYRYLRPAGLLESDMAHMALDFLEGRAFQLWKLELQHRKDNNLPINWEVFTTFMTSTFGVVDPERQARQQYDALRQDNLSVTDYIAEIKRLYRIMRPKPMICPSDGDVLAHFIANAKPELRGYLTSNTPEGYWTSLDQIFEKATTWALNKKAAIKPNNNHPSASPGVSAPAQKELNAMKRTNYSNHNQHGGKNRFTSFRGSAGPSGMKIQKRQKTDATSENPPPFTEEQMDRIKRGQCPFCKQSHIWTACPHKDQHLKRF